MGRRAGFKVAAVLLPLMLFVLVGELVARVCTGDWSMRHELSGWLLVTDNEDAPTQYDPVTGWALRPGAVHHHPQGAVYTIDADGLRSNGQDRPTGAAILTIGDSFTFGCDVHDAETWPSHLERVTLRPVLNGGVIGFGVDQATLRTEQLTAKHRPDLIVFAFIDDDIDRCGWAARQAIKPYFTADGALHNSPVPNVSNAAEIGAFRWALGYSRLVSLAAEYNQPFRERWYIGEYWRRAHNDGEAVSALLMKRLAAIDSPVVVVALPSPTSIGRERALLDAAKREGLDTLDLTGIEGVGYAPGGHYNDAGNRMVAEHIAGVIRDRR